MITKLDHIMLGTPDLDAGTDIFERLTGAKLATGGSHPGFGTRNRLASLGPDLFLELIAPDPDQDIRGKSRAESLAALTSMTLLTFAVQTDEIENMRAQARKAGLEAGELLAMSRARPDGVRLDWRVCHFVHPDYRNLVPFAIDWQGSPHPAMTAPGGCTLRSFAVFHPAPDPLRAIFERLAVDVTVQAATRPGLSLVLDTPSGEARFLG